MTAPKKATVATVPAGEVKAVPASIAQIENTVDSITNDPAAAAILSEATAKISPAARRGIYVAGIILGAVVTIGGAIAGSITGNAALADASVSGLALSLTNLLAVLHLNVPAAS